MLHYLPALSHWASWLLQTPHSELQIGLLPDLNGCTAVLRAQVRMAPGVGMSMVIFDIDEAGLSIQS